MKMYIGNNIKAYRERDKMTQADLAKRLDVSDKCIWSWEHNRTEPPSGAVQKMCDIFGCSVDELCKQITIDVSFDEYILIEQIRSAPSSRKREIERYIKYMTEMKGGTL